MQERLIRAELPKHLAPDAWRSMIKTDRNMVMLLDDRFIKLWKCRNLFNKYLSHCLKWSAHAQSLISSPTVIHKWCKNTIKHVDTKIWPRITDKYEAKCSLSTFIKRLSNNIRAAVILHDCYTQLWLFIVSAHVPVNQRLCYISILITHL